MTKLYQSKLEDAIIGALPLGDCLIVESESVFTVLVGNEAGRLGDERRAVAMVHNGTVTRF